MVFTLDFLLRIVTLILFFLWWCYWVITAREADREKPKTVPAASVFPPQFLRRWLIQTFEVLIVLQIFGLQVFPLPSNTFLPQVIGIILAISGVSISVSARKSLGTNWVAGYEYQIKNKQDLVTNGIYAYIRHPIYLGLGLALIGGELVAQSYLALIFLLFFIGWYWQARQEEKLLIKHFGNAYRDYMKRARCLFPICGNIGV